MAKKGYRHTQVGTFLIAVYSTLLLVFGVLYVLTNAWGLAVGQVLLLAALFVFSRMMIEVDREVVRIRLGFGLIDKKFNMTEIESCQVVRNRWWYGLGVRYTPHGWLFAVSGLDAVELTMKDGRHYRIGTDDPQGLAAAVGEVLGDGSI